MARDPRGQASSAATQSKGLPGGFKLFAPAPFAGINLQDSPNFIADQEFTWIENFLRLGNGKFRTAWDVGTPIYTAPVGRTIIDFFFFTIGPDYFCAVFLSDGSAVQITMRNLSTQTMGRPGTFYQSGNGQIPAMQPWGAQYLLISNRNTTNDFWAWDGSLLYTAGTAAPDGVVLASTGRNYNTNPTITAFGGHGSGMTFKPTVQAGGVVNVQITNPGLGYEVGDIVQLAFAGGGSDNSAILEATLGSGSVAAANVTAAGSGFTTATVAFSGGGGSGAAGTAVIGSGVSSVAVTAPGASYTVANMFFAGGGGSGAQATAVISGGQISSVDVTDAGSGYTSVPTVTISGDGSGATATASVSNGQIVGINITSGGTGYTSAPSITITGDGSGASAVALLASSSVAGVTVINPGSGFTYAPAVTFEGGNGTGATGTVQLVGTSIAKVNVINGGQNYGLPPTVNILPTSGGSGSGAVLQALIGGGEVTAIKVVNGGSGYTENIELRITSAFTNSGKNQDGGTGAAAAVVFTPTSISGVQMMNYGQQYTDAPAVVITSGANNSAYATVIMMPFGVSGSCMESYTSRLWIADPATQAYQTIPAGGQFQVSSPGNFTDFATSDGGVQFTDSSGHLQTRYVNIKQSNGYLYFFGDEGVDVVSNVSTTNSPATTTFNYQNVDPQTGCSWRDSLQSYGRTILFGNETGVYGLYGGAATLVSAKLQDIFNKAVFPPTAGALTPTSAIATLFDIKHYLMLMTMTDPDTGELVNKMVTWNEKDWTVTSQTVALTKIDTQGVSSKYTAWGTDGNKLYPLFNRASASLIKRLDTKNYGGDNPLMIKEFHGLWMTGQDQSQGSAGINFQTTFDISGLAIQGNPAAPNFVNETIPSIDTGTANIDLLVAQPTFMAPPPFWPLFGSGTGGAPFTAMTLRLATQSPDFILSHLMLGYVDVQAFYAG